MFAEIIKEPKLPKPGNKRHAIVVVVVVVFNISKI